MRTVRTLVLAHALLASACAGEIGDAEDGSELSDEDALLDAIPDLTVYEPVAYGLELMRLTNLDREAFGRPPLYVDSTLAAYARDKVFTCPSNTALKPAGRSQDMAARDYFSHDIKSCADPAGGEYSFIDVMPAVGYNTVRGENIGKNNYPLDIISHGYGCTSGVCVGTTPTPMTVSVVQNGFMGSTGHRNVILGDFDRFGCGVGRVGTGPFYYTCLFSKGGPNATTTAATTGLGFGAVTPARILDTRSGNGLSGAFTSGTGRTLQVTGRGGIPSNALAVTGNLTVTGATAAGYAALGPVRTNSPTTSTLSYRAGENRSSGVTIQLGYGGTLSAVIKSTSGATGHLIFDVTGYFYLGPNGSTYVPLDLHRLLDTRSGNGLSGAFVPNTPRTFQVSGRGNVPADSVAITGNLIVVTPTAAGYFALGPVSTASPTTSMISFAASKNRANQVTLKLGTGGTLSAVLKAAAGSSSHLVLDIDGYFVPGDSGAVYIPLTPTRLLDTRSGNGLTGTFASLTPRTFAVRGRGRVPSIALAVTGTMTATGHTSNGNVWLGPVATAAPPYWNLYLGVGDTRANGINAALSSTGGLSGTFKGTTGATTHLIFDVTGFFE